MGNPTRHWCVFSSHSTVKNLNGYPPCVSVPILLFSCVSWRNIGSYTNSNSRCFFQDSAICRNEDKSIEEGRCSSLATPDCNETRPQDVVFETFTLSWMEKSLFATTLLYFPSTCTESNKFRQTLWRLLKRIVENHCYVSQYMTQVEDILIHYTENLCIGIFFLFKGPWLARWKEMNQDGKWRAL